MPDQPIHPHLGGQIRRARAAHGLTAAQLAKDAGVPLDTVRKIENGQRVSAASIRKIAGALPDGGYGDGILALLTLTA